MKRFFSWFFLVGVLFSCSNQDVPDSTPSPEENLAPSDLTGTALVPDAATGFQIKALYVRGGPLLTRNGSSPSPLQLQQVLQPGDAVATPAAAETELYLQTADFSDGVVRVGDQSWVVFGRDTRPDHAELTVFLYGGKASFFLPPGRQDLISVWTPAGRLVSHGGIFNVTVSPTEQVLVASREGEVVLVGRMMVSATPGRALALNRPGSWTYPVPANDAAQLQDRWLKVMTEEAPSTLLEQIPNHATRLESFSQDSASLSPFFEEEVTSLVVWAWQAKTLLPADRTASLPSQDALQNLWKKASQTRALRQGLVWPWETSLLPPALLGLNS